MSTNAEKSEVVNTIFVSQTTSADKDVTPDTGEIPKKTAKLSHLSTTSKKVFDILTDMQSGFKKQDSTIYQITRLVNQLYESVNIST